MEKDWRLKNAALRQLPYSRYLISLHQDESETSLKTWGPTYFQKGGTIAFPSEKAFEQELRPCTFAPPLNPPVTSFLKGDIARESVSYISPFIFEKNNYESLISADV